MKHDTINIVNISTVICGKIKLRCNDIPSTRKQGSQVQGKSLHHTLIFQQTTVDTCVDTHRCIDTSIHWYISTLIDRYIDALMH